MYVNSAVANLSVTAGSTTALAATGVSALWLGVAAFALISAGLALLRIVPRREA